MPRKRMEEFQGKGPEREDAVFLAKSVFKLQKDLGISRKQMAEESGLSNGQLGSLFTAWANEKANYLHMESRMANGLVRFWNLHLINSAKVKAAPMVIRPKKVASHKDDSLSDAPIIEESALEGNSDLINILIARVGKEETVRLLRERNKLDALTPEQLADLV